MDYKHLLDYCLDKMAEAGAGKAQVVLSVSEKHELNTENNTVKLLRSTEEFDLNFKFIKDQRAASTSINKQSTEAIDAAIEKLVDLSKAAPVDEASDISEFTEPKVFEIGVLNPNFDQVYEALEALNAEMKTNYKSIYGDAILSYDRRHKYVANSNGVRLEEVGGHYSFTMMFSAKEGDRITSFNYTGASTCELKKKLLELGALEELLDQSIKELDAKAFEGKFVGDVIIAPSCLEEFLEYLSGAALADGSLIAGSSKFKNKMGEQVASPMLTWHSNPTSAELAPGYTITGDGFVAEDLTIIENGVLKSFLISQYGANKVGLNRSGNYGNAFIVEPGEKSLAEMVKNVKRGILLNRFSGGRPGPDGDFAGVAKNSFYIEDGEIKYPITKTMVSGNLFEFINAIEAISNRRINYGNCVLPWIHTKGGTISGQ